MLFPQGIDGELDRGMVLSSGVGRRGMPFTEGRHAKSLFRESIGAVLRLETGAAAPESEVTELMDRYYPNPGDSEDTARSKVSRLQKRLDTASSAIRYPEGVERPTEDSVGQQSAPQEGDVIEASGKPDLIFRNGEWVEK